jgi:hypothetical protein
MGLSRADEDLSVNFVPDDKQHRLDFDRQLAGYVRHYRERWDITALLELFNFSGQRPARLTCTCTAVRREAWR